ncbi:prolyl 4-hydroxylase subunit alpha-1-like [Haliotis cracherodii]|uniref:prolyl 4-hydroxylase subunit alpha-1-like n=1 Tax=Haliotis cracherodii TaxID=6455 RepID=UPI0039ED7B76
MARKRIPKRQTGIQPRVPVHSTDTGSDSIPAPVTSSIRIILLILIGLGICAFLFYPDITRLVSSLQGDANPTTKEQRGQPVDQHRRDQQFDSDEESFAGRRHDDLMMTEEEDDEIEVEDFDEEPVENDQIGDLKEEPIKHNPEFEREQERRLKDEVKRKEREKMSERDSSRKTAPEDEKKFIKFTKDEAGVKTLDIKMEDMTKEPVKKKSKEAKPKTEQKKQEEKTPSQDNQDLPKEVRDFKARILSTVTAKKIFADGRRIPPVELLPQKPTNSSVRVFLFEEFLSKDECDGLMKAHDKHVQDAAKQDPILCFDSIGTLKKHLKEAKKNIRVTPNVFTHGTKCVNATFSRQIADFIHRNWSYSTAFYPGESKFSTIFANRVKAAMGLDQENGGKFQLTSYPKGKAYKSHTDCVEGGEDKRDRVATVLVYLQDVEEGGETRFPELGIWVKPRKGRALVWNNMSPDGDCERHSIHTASRVDKGNKYILIRWYYYKSFYSLGKRPPEPPLPQREAGQPRVSCDEFEYGSCRWYDEWSYEHMLEYERQKMTLI